MNNRAAGAIDAQVHELEAAPVDHIRHRTTARQWVARFTVLTMVVTGVIAPYFGPSQDNAQPVLDLNPTTRTVI